MVGSTPAVVGYDGAMYAFGLLSRRARTATPPSTAPPGRPRCRCPRGADPADDCCSTPLVAYDGDLYEFSGMLPVWYSASNGTTWSVPAKLAGTWGNGAQVGYGKALAVADGHLYAVWEAPGGSGAVRYSYFDGSTWAAPATVAGTAGPKSSHFALGASRGPLYMAWLANRHIEFTYAANVGPPRPLHRLGEPTGCPPRPACH
jgi:hypothetical protein